MSVTRDDQSTLVLRCVNVLVTSSSEVTCPHLAPARYQEFGGNHLTVAARRIEPSDQADSTLRMRDLTMHICPELLVPICQDGTLSTYCDKPSLCLQCPHQAPDQATHIDFFGMLLASSPWAVLLDRKARIPLPGRPRPLLAKEAISTTANTDFATEILAAVRGMPKTANHFNGHALSTAKLADCCKARASPNRVHWHFKGCCDMRTISPWSVD